MPAPTPGYVKNMIRRSLREICDPSPKKKDEKFIWDFFDSECAYCGKKLDKAKKEGHLDHLVSSAIGGSNCLSNRVLSCANCNEKEKLDMPWEEFLGQKNPEKSMASRRKDKILKWMNMNETAIIRKDILDKLKAIGDDAVAAYDEKVELTRQLRNL